MENPVLITPQNTIIESLKETILIMLERNKIYNSDFILYDSEIEYLKKYFRVIRMSDGGFQFKKKKVDQRKSV
jgi:hypothetical protein